MMIYPLVKMGSLRQVMEDSNDAILSRYLPRTVCPHIWQSFATISQRVNQQIIGIGRRVAYLHSQNPPIIHGDLHPVSSDNMK